MAGNKIRFTFEIYAGNTLVRTEELTQDIIKVGKLPSSHLRIDDDGVSRMHAYIEVTGTDEVVIMDLGSSSGTFVNGQKVNKTKIKSGDEVTLGGTRIVVLMAPADAPAIAAAPAAAPAAPKPAAAPAPAAPAAPKPAAAPAAAKPSPFAPGAAAKPAAAPGAKAPNPFGPKPALANPFAPTPAQAEDEEELDDDQAYYRLVPMEGAVPPQNEVDAPAQALEVSVLWGDHDVLHVSHLSPPRAFVVGEPEGKAQPDFLMEGEFLGVPRYPVTTSEGGVSAVVVPNGATVVVRNGSVRKDMTQLNSEGALVSSSALSGALQYRIGENDTVRVKHKGFTFQVKAVPAGKRVGGAMKPDWVPLGYVSGVGVFFGVLFLIGYFMAPGGGQLNGDQLDLNNQYVQALLAPPEQPPPEEEPQSNSSESAGGQGERARDDEGQMGEERAERTNNRYAIQGNANPQDQQMAREAAIEQAQNAGALGVLAAMTSALNGPTSPYGADQAIGADPMSALGAMMGSQIGSNAGFGGLGLRGTGIGGGGTGAGTIGMGSFGTIGNGGGTGTGQGYGRGVGGLREHGPVVPRVRAAGATDVSGNLSAEVIRRVIQRHLNEVAFCYEQGLHSNPQLQGRVSVRFIISTSGSVQTAMVASSSLGNGSVESCISSAVRRWAFPAPEGGIVAVTYPFTLTPAAAGGD